ncbi:hypothetical protein ATCC90586_007154 [Pythium insidiosum]|nr:hypothetical protein ATCC90586_007154 [Pythium insidiosum]
MATTATMAKLPSFAADVTDAVDMHAYGELQTRLRALQYDDPVGVDSVALVTRLLRDVESATDKRDALARDLELAQREAIELSQIILPLRKENARLLRENNSLHLEIIQQEEAVSERERRCELELEQLRDAMSQLQFVSTQRAQTVAEKEQEISRLHAQLERLMATTTPGAKQLQPTIELSSRARGRTQPAASGAADALNQSAVQDAQVMDELEDQLRAVAAEKDALHADVQRLRAQLEHREKEIARLAQLSVDRVQRDDPAARRELAGAGHDGDETAELQIEQLTAQLDLLNDQVAKYEARLKSANEQLRRHSAMDQKLRQAESLNEQLQRELDSARAKLSVLEMDKLAPPSELQQHPDAGAAPLSPRPAASQERSSGKDLAALRERVSSLEAENSRLEEALRATHYDKVSFTNALANANSHNKVLSSDLARAEAKASEAAESRNETRLALAEARAETDARSRELDALRESLRHVEQQWMMEKEKNEALHRELRAMDRVLQQRDEECQGLQRTLQVQQGELDRMTSRIAVLEEAQRQSGDDDDDDGATATPSSSSAATAKALHQKELKWLEEERRELRQRIEELTRDVLAREREVQSCKTDLQATQLERDELKRSLEHARKREEGVASMMDAKRQELQALQRELASQKELRRQSDEKLAETTARLSHAEEFDNDRLRYQHESLELKRRVEELRDANAGLSHRAEQSERNEERLAAQVRSLKEEVGAFTSKAHAHEKEYGELQTSYETIAAELRSVRQQCSHYQREYEALLAEYRENDATLNSEKAALHTSQTHLGDLRAQVRQLQSQLVLAQDSLHQVESRLEQEKVGHRDAQRQLVLARDENLQLVDVKRSLEISNQELRDKLRAREATVTEKSETADNLRILLEQMEASRDQLMFKLQQEQQGAARQRQEIEDLHRRLSDAESSIERRDAEIKALKKLTRTLDAEKDDANDQLDTLTEKYHDAMTQLDQANTRLKNDVEARHELDSQLARAVERLDETETKCRSLEARCEQLARTLESEQREKAMSEAERFALAQDLENMTIENQALSEECSRLHMSAQQGSQSSSRLQQRVRDAEKERDILNIELEDLRDTYRALAQECEALRRHHGEAVTSQDDLASTNEGLRSQVAALRTEVESLREKNATLSTESVAFRDQVTFLTEKLRAHDELLAETEEKQERLQGELTAQREVAQEISAQRYGAQAQNAAVAQKIVHLEAKLGNAKHELRLVQDKLQAEQTQRRNLETVVATLRQQVATRETTIETLTEQRDALADEIRVLHQRLVASDAMDMTELNPTPPRAGSSGFDTPDQPTSRARHSARAAEEEQRAATPGSGDMGRSSSSSILPMRALREAEEKCRALEEKLAKQDEAIQLLERSRSKFKRFAARYEREIETRDRVIEELRVSHASSTPPRQRSPDHPSPSPSRSSSAASHNSNASSASDRPHGHDQRSAFRDRLPAAHERRHWAMRRPSLIGGIVLLSLAAALCGRDARVWVSAREHRLLRSAGAPVNATTGTRPPSTPPSSSSSSSSDPPRRGVAMENCSAATTLTVSCWNESTPDAFLGSACVGSTTAGTCPRGPSVVSITPDGVLAASSMGIEQFVPIPRSLAVRFRNLRRVLLQGNALASFQLFDGYDAHVDELQLTNNRFSSYEAIRYRNAKRLNASGNALGSVRLTDSDSYVQVLDLSSTSLKSFDGSEGWNLLALHAARNLLQDVRALTLLNKLRSLDVSFNQLADWSEFRPPSSLRELTASHNGATQFVRGNWSTLTKFRSLDFSYNRIETVTGVVWPSSIESIDLRGNPLQAIEIQESDVPTFKALKQLRVPDGFSTKECKSHDAFKATVSGGVSVCVIPDASFQVSPEAPIIDSLPASNEDTISSRSSSGWVVAVLVLVLTAAFAGFVYVFHYRGSFLPYRSRTKGPSGAVTTTSNVSVLVSALDELQGDPSIAAFRIDAADVFELSVVQTSTSSSEVLLKGRWKDRDVIARRLQADVAAKNPRALTAFIDEIRHRAPLEHAKIVAFIGFSWATGLDLTIYSEDMPHGDLEAFLKLQGPNRALLSWLENAPQQAWPSKLDMAIDILEALVFLHSLEPPIVHGGLRARTVLLSAAWTAKVAYARPPVDSQAAMASENGAVAWIAPEILRGDTAWSTASDIYAFGVLLAELDTCELPFRTLLAGRTSSDLATEIVERELRPLFRADCPRAIVDMAKLCWQAEATKRPAATALHFELTRLLRASDASSSSSA